MNEYIVLSDNLRNDNTLARVDSDAAGGPRDHRVTIPYPHEISGMDCHAKAAVALCKKMGWTGKLHGGRLKDCYVFVLSPHGSGDYGAYKI